MRLCRFGDSRLGLVEGRKVRDVTAALEVFLDFREVVYVVLHLSCDGGWRCAARASRVLRPGSRFLCLEFSTVDVPGLDRLYDMFSFKVIPQLGKAVTGDAESYRYLVESIRKFPKPNAFAEMIRAAGFSRVNHQTLSGGIVALHSGWRL